MDTITDRFGLTYTVTRTQLDGGTAVYHVYAGEALVAPSYGSSKVASTTSWCIARPIVAEGLRRLCTA
jgi:hypothetical protein